MKLPDYKTIPTWDEKSVPALQKIGNSINSLFFNDFRKSVDLDQMKKDIFRLLEIGDGQIGDVEGPIKYAIDRFVSSSKILEELSKEDCDPRAQYGVSVKFDKDVMTGELSSLVGAININLMLIHYEKDPFSDKELPRTTFESGRMYFGQSSRSAEGSYLLKLLPMFDNFVAISRNNQLEM